MPLQSQNPLFEDRTTVESGWLRRLLSGYPARGRHAAVLTMVSGSPSLSSAIDLPGTNSHRDWGQFCWRMRNGCKRFSRMSAIIGCGNESKHRFRQLHRFRSERKRTITRSMMATRSACGSSGNAPRVNLCVHLSQFVNPHQ
jgi:hypothetical protein